jgi:hypothetical protein
MINASMTHEEIIFELKKLQDDPTMTTKSIYSPQANDYPGNQLPFVEIHMNYLRKNKSINPSQYLSNLRIMIKKRG